MKLLGMLIAFLGFSTDTYGTELEKYKPSECTVVSVGWLIPNFLKGYITIVSSYTVRFRKEVIPGDRLDIETEVVSWSRGICRGKGVGRTNGEVACEAEMTLTIPEILQKYLPRARS